MGARETRNRIAGYGENGVGDGRSIADLFRELSTEGRTLVRQEVELAKAEMAEKARVYARSTASIAIGGAVLLVAALAIGTAVVYGLIVLFDAFLPFEVAVWLAPLVLGGVLAMVGLGMIRKATAAISEEGVVPQRTIETLREDKDWVQRKVR